MEFDDILLEILNEFVEGKKVNIEEYCKKYPQYKDGILSKFRTAEFIKKNFEEEDLSGKKLGDYTILQELGRGGMGIVFLGIQPALSRLTAIKVLPPSFAYDKEALKNFQEEAKIIAKFNHPNIVPIYSISNERGINYIAMGYISGLSLKNIIEKLKDTKQIHRLKAIEIKEILQGTFSEQKDISQKSISLKRGLEFWNMSYYQFIATIGAEIAKALSYAHQNDISHGDLKPSNILLTKGGIPVIVDFGLSKNIKELSESKLKDFTGTLEYAAPEQIKENVISEKTDIWSVGATLYELLTFKNPFRKDKIKHTVDNILKANPVPPRAYNKKMPLELEAIILKCLETKPENRYGSTEELSRDLNNYLESKPTVAKPLGRIGRLRKWVKRNPRISYLIIIAIIFTLTSGYFYSINSWKKIADNYHDKGEYNKSIQMYTKVLKLAPKDIQSLLLIADSYYWMGDYDTAISFYKKALEVSPNYPYALLSIGDIYYDINEFDKAIEYYKKTLVLTPKERSCLISLARTYEETESYAEAIYYYAKAAILAPGDLDIIQRLASLIEEEEKITDSSGIREYLKGIKLDKQETSSIIKLLKTIKDDPAS